MTDRWVIVTLSWFEIAMAGQVALQRVLFNLERGVREKHGAVSELGGFDYHFAGCIGELATAKHCNYYWTGGVGNFTVRDVGGQLQVRARTRASYELPLHPEDKDEDIFVLAHVVAASLPRVRLSGWLRGQEGKQPQFWKDLGNGRPAFFVPIERLGSMADLVI